MIDLKEGQILLSRFSLVKRLGEGGMGQVWQVCDQELQIDIAIKILNPELASRPDQVELLKNECRNTRLLVHPNIVRVFDFHRTEDLAFISMEYIQGEDLSAYRRHIQAPIYPAVIRLLQPVVHALSYAHDMGLVHRDVKAGNVLMDREETPRLTDFGIAGIFKTGMHALNITSGGSMYSMSPQQLEGHQPRPSDDIYALGVLMYELITGFAPFYPDITAEKIRSEIPPTVNQQLDRLNSKIRIPGSLENLIIQMMQKDPADRPSSMQEIQNILQDVLDNKALQTIPPNGCGQTWMQEMPSENSTEIITPLQVLNQDQTADKRDHRRTYLFKTATLIAALVVILIGGGLLWHYLPKYAPQYENLAESRLPAETRVEENFAEAPQEQPPPTVDPAGLAVEKKNAEQTLAEFLEAKGELDRKGVSEWGGQLYTDLTKLGQAADAFFMQKEYSDASENYAQATAIAKELAARTGEALNRLLEEGQSALGLADGDLAQRKFETARMIDASNPMAQRGLQRAKTIEAVMQLIESGKQHEKNNSLSLAHTDYEEALRTDPYSEEARKALSRVNSLIKENQFTQLMSEGLAAFHRNDFQLARSKLLKAKSLKPDSREVVDALSQVDQAIRLARIDTLQQEAQAAEKNEDWEKALNSYLTVLNIDKNVQFANRGKERVLEQIRLTKRIQFFLKQPQVLQSDKQLKNAILLLNEAGEIGLKGPRLTAALKELEGLVEVAKTPVKVTIASDNLTDVAVYKVGKLGKFSVHELELRPGTYTVVGARDGYQDFRQEIVVTPGQKSLHITVACRIKI